MYAGASLAQLRFRRSIWTGALDAYLEELYVAPKSRGRGIGRALLEGAMGTAREEGAAHIDLTTSEADTTALSLYEGTGFTNREGTRTERRCSTTCAIFERPAHSSHRRAASLSRLDLRGREPCEGNAMDADRVLAFRLARSGLAAREARDLAKVAACPASDFAPGAALLALTARGDGLSREGYREAVDAGELVLAHSLRSAIHALSPGDLDLYGRALISRDDDELGAQLGRQLQRLAAEKGFAPTKTLAEVAGAAKEALARGRALDKNELHEELRVRVRAELMPWCRGCESHHVAPMLWRYATVQAGVQLDSERRYSLAKPGRARSRARRSVAFSLSTAPPGPPPTSRDGPGSPRATPSASGTCADMSPIRALMTASACSPGSGRSGLSLFKRSVLGGLLVAGLKDRPRCPASYRRRAKYRSCSPPAVAET